MTTWFAKTDEEARKPRCTLCINLRCQQGEFWCSRGYDADYIYKTDPEMPEPPIPQTMGWLQTPEGKKWSRLMAEACPDFEEDK
jgi:hypothetical protein